MLTNVEAESIFWEFIKKKNLINMCCVNMCRFFDRLWVDLSISCVSDYLILIHFNCGFMVWFKKHDGENC